MSRNNSVRFLMSEGGGDSGGGASAPAAAPAAPAPVAAPAAAPAAPTPAPTPAPAPAAGDTKTAAPRRSLAEKLQDIKNKRQEKIKEETIETVKKEAKAEAEKEFELKIPKEEKGPTPAEKAQKEAAKAQKAAEKAQKEVEKYVPDYKFKVKDKEFEVDEFLRGAIKDKETEQKIKDLYGKAHGLDFERTRAQEREQQLAPVMQRLTEANAAYERNDMESVFKAMNIPEEKVLQWLVNKAQYQEMDPAQRQIYDDRKMAQENARKAEIQNQELQRTQNEAASKAKLREFEIHMKVPAHAEYAANFEASRTKGAFRQAIAERGELAALRGKDISVEEAINEVMQVYGPQGASPTATQSQGASGNAASGSGSKRETPVIPNVGGRSESAVASVKKFKSVEDLKAHRKALQAQRSV